MRCSVWRGWWTTRCPSPCSSSASSSASTCKRVAGQKMMASSSFQLSLYCVGFFVMIWITSVMFNSNDILRKQTALKATRLRERPCHCHDGCSFWPDRGMKTCGIPSFGRTSSSGGLHVMS
uniref:Uncharacterized protein n=1 Tax=Triticum urartu TaxID=4572 RepID=A0A8R7Q2V5_TRIUA